MTIKTFDDDVIIEKDLYVKGTTFFNNTKVTVNEEIQNVPIDFQEFIDTYNKTNKEIKELRKHVNGLSEVVAKIKSCFSYDCGY